MVPSNRKFIILLLMILTLVYACSLFGKKTTQPVIPSQDFKLDLVNTITEIDIVNYHRNKFLNAYLDQNSELRTMVEEYLEIEQILASPNPDNERMGDLIDDFGPRAGVIWDGKDLITVDQSKFDKFIDYFVLEMFYTSGNNLTHSMHLLTGTPILLPTHDLNYELIHQIIEPLRFRTQEALKDNNWSTEDQKEFGFDESTANQVANSFDEYLAEIDALISKGQSHPDQIKQDDLYELYTFEMRLLEILFDQCGLEIAVLHVETIKGTDHIKVTIKEKEEKNDSSTNITFTLKEDGIFEEEIGGIKYVLLKNGTYADAWEMIDEGKYAMLISFRELTVTP